MRELKLVTSVERLEDADVLDPAIESVRNVVNAVVRPQAVRDILHGVPTGHPVHPIAVLIPVGSWLSAAILDVVPGTEKAAETLIAVGISAAGPAALAGYTDWSELRKPQQRVGLVHSISNLAAVGLYAASLVQRKRGHIVSGKVLSFAGLAIVSGAGFLGGHLSYRQSAGANHVAGVYSRFPEGWHTLGLVDEFPEGRLVRKDVEGVSVVVLRQGVTAHVIADECSHCSASLATGQLIGDPDDPRVACPETTSVFELRTGLVVSGPATSPQPRFDAVVSEGMIEIRVPA
jgi:nitrite reductase/ring-hydroxylating ferredoxin subunit/uncharacterized membrane protein